MLWPTQDIIPIILGIIYVKKSDRRLDKFSKEQKKTIKDFKAKLRKVLVNLDEVEVKSNSWTEEQIINRGRYSGLDEMMGYKESSVRKINNQFFKITLWPKIAKYKIDT